MSRWSAEFSCAREIAAPERTPAFAELALHRHPIKTSCEIKRIMTRSRRSSVARAAHPQTYAVAVITQRVQAALTLVAHSSHHVDAEAPTTGARPVLAGVVASARQRGSASRPHLPSILARRILVLPRDRSM